MRSSLGVLLLLTACSHKPSYGDKAHLLGKLDGFDLRGGKAEVAAVSTTLADGSDVDDGPLTYRVWFDKTGKIERLMEFVRGPIDDAFAAWGSGTLGSYADQPARYYFDAAAKTRIGVLQKELTSETYIIVARSYRPFGELVGAGKGIQIAGVDVLGRPADDVVHALAGKDVVVALFDPGMPSLDEFMRSWFSNEILTELGTCKLTLFDYHNTGAVSSYDLDCDTGEILGASEKMLEVFAAKWGKPTEDAGTFHYPGDAPSIVAERRMDNLKLSVRPAAGKRGAD